MVPGRADMSRQADATRAGATLFPNLFRAKVTCSRYLFRTCSVPVPKWSADLFPVYVGNRWGSEQVTSQMGEQMAMARAATEAARSTAWYAGPPRSTGCRTAASAPPATATAGVCVRQHFGYPWVTVSVDRSA